MGKTRVTGASTGGKESTGDKAVAARAAQGKPGEEEALQKPEVRWYIVILLPWINAHCLPGALISPRDQLPVGATFCISKISGGSRT